MCKKNTFVKLKFKKMKKTLTVICFLLTIVLSKSYSQFSIDNIEEIDQLKNATTYIAMKELDSDLAKDYIQFYKDNWTFSEIKFITYSEIKDYLQPDNYFFSIGGYETTVQTYNAKMAQGLNWSNTHLYLELWTCSDKFFKNNKKKILKIDDKKVIARIELFTDFQTLMKPTNIYDTDYEGDAHIRNWGKGILKNYIQYLMTSLEQKEKKDLYRFEPKSSELENLKTNTLYVPDYVFIKFNKFTGDESKKHDEKDIFKDYSLKYEVLPTKELNEKILNSSEPFYYLIYIKSSTDKYVSVLNSKTGEIIYTSYTPVSYNIKSKDLKELEKKIK